MTREEAIKKIKSLCHDCVEFPHCVNTDPDCFKALEIAIKALEQIPDLKEAYDKGYKDGQKALAVHKEEGNCDYYDSYNQTCRRSDVPKEPYGDCISRQAVLEAFNLSEKTRKYGGDHSGYDTMMLYEIQDVIEDLPSIQPKPKTGHWIEHKNNGVTYIECSECLTWFLRFHLVRNSYCSNCGAKMSEIQTGSEKAVSE